MPQEGFVLTTTGAVAILQALFRSRPLTLRYGLYSNDWWPQTADNIGRYTPADFPGYSGFQVATPWGLVTTDGDLAVIQSAPITWIRGAGLGGGWVFGYYTVDQDGVLFGAERVFGYGGVVIGHLGQPCTVTPTIAMGSRYPGGV